MAKKGDSRYVDRRLGGQMRFAREVAESGAELEALGLTGAQEMAKFARAAAKLKKSQ